MACVSRACVRVARGQRVAFGHALALALPIAACAGATRTPLLSGPGDASIARDVLDAVRDLSVLVDSERAARSLVQAALAIAAGDRAWRWFYDAEAGVVYDGSDPDAPQLPADRGLVAFSVWSKSALSMANATLHPVYGGAVDLACISLGDRLRCQPIVAPDGACHAALVVIRGANRERSHPVTSLP